MISLSQETRTSRSSLGQELLFILIKNKLRNRGQNLKSKLDF